jgi:hypothetical protein
MRPIPVLLAAALAAHPLAAAEPTSFEFIGSVELPHGLAVDGEPVGGLSSLAWDPATGELLALSDDRSELAPARIFLLRVDLADGRLDAGDVSVVGRLRLARPDGSPFPRRSLDPEGLVLDGDRMFVSSEGEAKTGQAPWVAEFDRSGRELAELPLPARFVPDGHERYGVRDNLAFESLALSPDRKFLFTGTETALVQDGPSTDTGSPSLARLLRWRLDRPDEPPAEFAYRVEAVSVRPPTPDAFRINGLVELLALSPTHLLALERQFVSGVGVEVKLYRIELDEATDVADRDDLAAPDVRLPRKELLIDFADLGVPLDNFEGLALGPRLPDGRQALFVVSDDNFDAAAQKTLLFAFAVDDAPLTIARVQGAAHESPLAGRWVTDVPGVVTAVLDRPRATGFWMESPTPDGDPDTSEGLFVAWRRAPLPAPGTRIEVDGRVLEVRHDALQLPVTTLVASDVAEVGSASLPPPVRLGVDRRVPQRLEDDALAVFDPDQDALDFWESLEGMRVELGGGVVSGPTLAYDELALLPDDLAGAPRSVAGGALLAGETAPPLARVLLSGRLCGGLPRLAVGARLGGPITGVVDYSFSNYKVLPLAPPAVVAPGHDCAARTTLAGDRRRLTVATFNVENLSAAGPPERFARLGGVIAGALGAPAVVALEEIQDDSGPAGGDGVITARATLGRLVEGVAAAGGPRYEAIEIDPETDREGGQPGGNIRVALLVDRARVGFSRRGSAGALDDTAIEGRGRGLRLTPNPGRVAPRSEAFTLASGEGVRRSLAVELEAGGRPLYVIVNHWTSKWDDDRDWGARQPPEKPTAARRLAQAHEIRAFVERLLARDPNARVVVLGDLNDVPGSAAVEALARPPLVDLLDGVPAASRYTINFEGVAEDLDHIVVSPALASGAAAEVVHLDADCPAGVRVSDHDPVVARVRVR